MVAPASGVRWLQHRFSARLARPIAGGDRDSIPNWIGIIMVWTLALIPALTRARPLARPCGPSALPNSFHRFPIGSSLPQGEGELFAGSLECCATGLAGQSSASRKSCAGMSSPWGEETGEGDRKIKSRNLTGVVVIKRIHLYQVPQPFLVTPDQRQVDFGHCRLRLAETGDPPAV